MGAPANAGASTRGEGRAFSAKITAACASTAIATDEEIRALRTGEL